jgi:CubicO group peptidase (beta-lactamase class C family)
MTVLADPDGPLDDTVPAERPVTLRDLLTFTLGTGIVVAEPGTIPIADALNALQGEEPGPSPDEWIRRLGTLPLVRQPGERWMYHTAADVTGVLIARATGMSFGDALRERICEPLGMKDTAFSVAGESISRLATAYQRDDATGEIVVEDGPTGLPEVDLFSQVEQPDKQEWAALASGNGANAPTPIALSPDGS